MTGRKLIELWTNQITKLVLLNLCSAFSKIKKNNLSSAIIAPSLVFDSRFWKTGFEFVIGSFKNTRIFSFSNFSKKKSNYCLPSWIGDLTFLISNYKSRVNVRNLLPWKLPLKIFFILWSSYTKSVNRSFSKCYNIIYSNFGHF